MLEPSRIFRKGALTGELASFLVGRSDLIDDIANRLAEDKISAIIYGPRGVGKTTLAWQVASVLTDTNRRFKKKDVLKFGTDKKFEVVFHKCSARVDTVGDLLVEIILSNSDKQSFGKKFSSYFRDKDKIEKIKTRYGFDLKLFNFSQEIESSQSAMDARAESQSDKESRKIALFQEVTDEILSERRYLNLLIVVDEIDRPLHYRDGIPLPSSEVKHIKELGTFLKDNEQVQFLFVGIGASISALISDHRSAGRKLSGNIFEAPLLGPNEIDEIFEIAAKEAKGELSISAPFRDLAVRYSGGMPWLAQHIGFEAVYQKSRQRKSKGALELTADDFHPAIQRATEVYQQDNDFRIPKDLLDSAGAADFAILRELWDAPQGITEDVLRQCIPPRFIPHFGKTMNELLAANIIGHKGPLLVFSDQVLRVFVKFMLDERDE